MKVLILSSTSDPVSGYGRITHSLIDGMPDVQFECLSSENRKGFLFGKKNLKSEFYQRLGVWVVFWDFINILITISKKPDIIHAVAESYAAVSMLLSRFWKIPYIIISHGTYGVLLPVKYRLFRLAFKEADRVVAVSHYTLNRMKQENIEFSGQVILNGVDVNKFTSDPLISREKSILFVGNLKKRKGFFDVLKVMQFVVKHDPGISLWFVGGIDQTSLEFVNAKKIIDKSQINVTFFNEINHDLLVSLYRRTLLNILPSVSDRFFFEGFGLVHAEANACGAMTLGTFNSGNEDAIPPGNGYLVKCGDVKKMATIILDLAQLTDYPSVDFGKIVTIADMANNYHEVYELLVLRKTH